MRACVRFTPFILARIQRSTRWYVSSYREFGRLVILAPLTIGSSGDDAPHFGGVSANDGSRVAPRRANDAVTMTNQEVVEITIAYQMVWMVVAVANQDAVRPMEGDV